MSWFSLFLILAQLEVDFENRFDFYSILLPRLSPEHLTSGVHELQGIPKKLLYNICLTGTLESLLPILQFDQRLQQDGGMRTGDIQHFSHNQHALSFVHLQSEYRCDGCQESGYGFRYRCGPCDFDMHESCAQAPKSILHSCHPQHHLVLRDKPVSPQRVCDVCGRDVLGFVYDCRGCGVDVHPSCAKLPQTLRHALHPHHTLQLLLYTYTPEEAEAQAPPARICNVCGEACSPGHWGYRCEASTPCDFNLHIPCAKLLVDPFEEIRMQSISPLEVPRHNSAAVNSSAAPTSTGVAGQVESVMQSGLEAQVELMKIQNKMMVASAALDVQRACALSWYRRY